MREKRNQKKRRILRLLIICLVLYVFVAIVFQIFGMNIKNIRVEGNYYFTEQQIIDMARLTDYPNFYYNNPFVIRRRLQREVMIQDVQVRIAWYNRVNITITERKRLFYDKREGVIVLSDGKTMENDFKQVPILINYVPRELYQKLIHSMDNLDQSIINRISDITYTPNEVDRERFALNMIDGNLVFINITRFNNLNRYDSIKERINNHTGILNLDYGTNFEVREW